MVSSVAVSLSPSLSLCVLCGSIAEFDTTFVKPQNGHRNVTFIMQKVSKQTTNVAALVAIVVVVDLSLVG